MYKKIVLIAGYFAVSASVTYVYMRAPATKNSRIIDECLVWGLFIVIPLIALTLWGIIRTIKQKNELLKGKGNNNGCFLNLHNTFGDTYYDDYHNDISYNPAFSHLSGNICHNNYDQND